MLRNMVFKLKRNLKGFDIFCFTNMENKAEEQYCFTPIYTII